MLCVCVLFVIGVAQGDGPQSLMVQWAPDPSSPRFAHGDNALPHKRVWVKCTARPESQEHVLLELTSIDDPHGKLEMTPHSVEVEPFESLGEAVWAVKSARRTQ